MAILALASVASVAVILYLNREASLYFDEAYWFADLARRDGLDSILYPHNSHLIGTTRAAYLLVVNAVGPDYVVMRIMGVAAVVACAWAFFALARVRIGAWAALVPSVLLLFYGSAWQHVVGPIGFTVVLSAALGLLAFLALERGDRTGDVRACLLLIASIFTYTVGIPFLVGTAVLILLGSDRLRRAWVFLVPGALYGAWYLWATQFSEARQQASSLADVPEFLGASAANIAGAVSGVNGLLDGRPNALGWIVAALALAALAFRISRGGVPRTLWASLAVLGTYWLAAATADNGTTAIQVSDQAGAVRYVYPATIGFLLVAVDAVRGLRITKAGYAALFAAGLFAIAMNVSLLRDGGVLIRGFGNAERTNLAMLELANGWEPGLDEGGRDGTVRPEVAEEIGFLEVLQPDRDDLLEASARYGSPAFDLDEIRERSQESGGADAVLLQAYGLAPADGEAPSRRSECERGTAVELEPGEAYALRGDGELTLARFGPVPGPPAGALEPDGWSALDLPDDPAPEPWVASAAEGELVACPAG